MLHRLVMLDMALRPVLSRVLPALGSAYWVQRGSRLGSLRNGFCWKPASIFTGVYSAAVELLLLSEGSMHLAGSACAASCHVTPEPGPLCNRALLRGPACSFCPLPFPAQRWDRVCSLIQKHRDNGGPSLLSLRLQDRGCSGISSYSARS